MAKKRTSYWTTLKRLKVRNTSTYQLWTQLEKYESYKPLAEDWQTKYENIRREKVVLQLEKDKLQKRVSELEGDSPNATTTLSSATTISPVKTSIKATESLSKPPATAVTTKSIKLTSTMASTPSKRTGIPDNRQNPWADKTVNPSHKLTSGLPYIKQGRSFKGHDATIIS